MIFVLATTMLRRCKKGIKKHNGDYYSHGVFYK